MNKRFDPAKLDKLNDPERLKYLDPDLIWRAAIPNDTKSGQKFDPEVLVDIGAGTGLFALIFSKKIGGQKGRIYACDISARMIEWMEANLPRPSDGGGVVIPLKMEESSVPLPGGVADMVYMIDLHHELDDPAATIREARRLLKGGGRLLIVDWKKEPTPEGPPLEIRVAEETIMLQMREGGFSDLKHHPVLPYHNLLTGEKR